MITNLLFPLLTALLAVASPVRRWAPPSPALSLSQYDQQVFDVSMQINDWSWEASTGWIEADDDNVSYSRRVLTDDRVTRALVSPLGTLSVSCKGTRGMM